MHQEVAVLPRPHSFDPSPVTKCCFPRDGWPRHDDDTAWPDELLDRRNEAIRPPNASHDGHLKGAPVLRGGLFCPGMYKSRVRQGEHSDGRGQERRSAPPGLEHRELKRWLDDLEWYPGKSSTRAHVHDPSRAARQDAQEKEAVQDELLDDETGVGRTHEAVNAVPFYQKFQVVGELLALALSQAMTGDPCRFLEEQLDGSPVRRGRRPWPRSSGGGGPSTIAAGSAGRSTRTSTTRGPMADSRT